MIIDAFTLAGAVAVVAMTATVLWFSRCCRKNS